MLELRPNCEYCDIDLPANATNAYICSYECTFCQECVEQHLKNVCPNCGGGFSIRPIRPSKEYREGISLAHQPASIKRILTTKPKSDIHQFIQTIKAPPEER